MKEDIWKGLTDRACSKLETRNYSNAGLATRLCSTGVGGGELIGGRGDLDQKWIPGVEVFPRRIFQQKGRGYFSELARTNEGVLHRIGLIPQQWAAALMHRDSAKGFHIHPPYVPENIQADAWFQSLFIDSPLDYARRPYHQEQWDVMFFLTGMCEMLLVDERPGLMRRIMRFTISGDSRSGPDNVAVVIPPGVGHALRSIGNEDLIMTYGTSTSFNPNWEGRIASNIENSPLPDEWTYYLSGNHQENS
jgi:dTDP-4-dehydrorhamnose 3,5-epimerase-like enzyme